MVASKCMKGRVKEKQVTSMAMLGIPNSSASAPYAHQRIPPITTSPALEVLVHNLENQGDVSNSVPRPVERTLLHPH